MIPFSVIYWDPKPELFRIPFLNWPVLWYGALFALGFAIGWTLFVKILMRYFSDGNRQKAIEITDRFTLYIIIATILGARLGHFLFYEDPRYYLANPLEVLRVWGGGLASHGAAIAIVIAIFLFSYRMKKEAPGLTWIRLLDFIAPPAALCGALIRIGNFINQEILGTVTSVPWAVVFLNPADRSLPSPRHPVVIYESLFYFAVFFLLWRLSHKRFFLQKEGKLIGLFFMLVFGFRFFIEYFKEEQSRLLTNSILTMGQILSIPLVLLGVFFYFFLDRFKNLSK